MIVTPVRGDFNQQKTFSFILKKYIYNLINTLQNLA